MKTKVKLYGELADIAVPEFDGYINSVRDAIRLLEVNFPAFYTYMASSGDRGVAFKVKVLDPQREHLENCWELSEDEIFDPTQGKEIHIIPVPTGSGGIGRIIAGIALIGLAFSGVGLLGLSPLMTGVMGGLLILQGVMGGKPEAPDPDDENSKSFVFNGSVNSASVGSRVPIAYGYRILVGSLVISANIRTFGLQD